MGLLRNLFSKLHKSLQKTKTESDSETSHSKLSLIKPVNITNKILLNNMDVEMNVTQETNTCCNDIKTVKNLGEGLTDACIKKTKENDLNTIPKVHESDAASNSVLLEKLFNNTNLSIKKVKIKDQTVDSEKRKNIQHKNLDQQRKDANISIRKEDSAALTVDLESGNYQNATANNSPKALNEETADAQNLKVVTALSVVSKSPNNLKVQYLNGDTQKCLQEFDDILAEVQRKDSSKVDTEALSLDDIDEILNEELEDVDSTYNFQEIKYYNADFHGSTVAYDCNNILGCKIDYSLFTVQNEETTVIKKLQNTNEASKADEIEIISLNTGDSQNTDEISPQIEATKNETIKNEVKKKGLKDKIDVVSLNSEGTSNTPNIHPNLGDAEIKTENIDEKTQLKTKNTDCDNEIQWQQKEKEEIENLETVSINSDVESDTEDDSGYHSSDFEFISDAEAKMFGLITNYNPERRNGIKICGNTNKVASKQYNLRPSKNVGRFNNYKRRKDDKSYMENYVVPDRNAFLNMFHGVIPNMPTCEIHFLENKSVRTRAPMLVQYEGVGFDMNLAMRRADSPDNEHREVAEESKKKILEMYPADNIKRKRRRRF